MIDSVKVNVTAWPELLNISAFLHTILLDCMYDDYMTGLTNQLIPNDIYRVI